MKVFKNKKGVGIIIIMAVILAGLFFAFNAPLVSAATVVVGSGSCTEVYHPGGGWWCDYWNFTGAAGGGPSCSIGYVGGQTYSSITLGLIGFVCYCNQNNCAANTCIGSTCNDGCGGTMNGTKLCCTPSCGSCSVSCGGGTQTCTRADCSTYTQSCNTQSCLSVPTGLTYSCDLGGSQIQLSWNSAPGASYYSIRVDKNYTSSESWNGAYWDANCTDSGSYAYCGDYCQNRVSGTSIILQIGYNAPYKWWMHARDASGNWSAAAVSYFVCPRVKPFPTTLFPPICSGDNSQVTLSWNSLPGSGISYAIGVDGNPPSWSDLDACSYCTDASMTRWGGDNYCQNSVYGTPIILNIQPGTPYVWWVHSRNEMGTWSDPAIGYFTCRVVNGDWSGWSDWSAWSNVGTCGQYQACKQRQDRSRTRTCTNPAPSGGGANCSGDSSETQTQYLDCGAVNGGWSAWSNVGSCGQYQACKQRQDRTCTSPVPSCGGASCSGAATQYLDCGTVNGGWSGWSDPAGFPDGAGGTCSKVCGIGNQSRTCTNPSPSCGGTNCSGSSSQSCNTQPCNNPPLATIPPASNPTAPDFCDTTPTYFFSWTYSDPNNNNESRFDFQVDNNSGFSSPEIDRSFPGLSYPSPTTNSQYAQLVPSVQSDKVTYGPTYYWQVKVYDSFGLDSGWVTGVSFSTPSHQYPNAKFNPTPQSPSVDENVQFTNQSTCYDDVSSGNPCNANDSFSWTFPKGNPASSNLQNPIVKFLSAGQKTVTLKVTDSAGSGFNCTLPQTINILLHPPSWIEIPPF